MNKLERAAGKMPISRKLHRKQCIAAGATKKAADEAYREAKNAEMWANDKYVVLVHHNTPHGFGELAGEMVELSIRRQDRQPVFDWRHMQEIKNQLVGEECEGVQLFPAESRLRDSSNQFWMYCFKDPKVHYPFGMMGRYVDDGEKQIGKSQQRKFECS